MTMTPEELAGHSNVLATLEQAYVLALQIPVGALRIRNQHTLSHLRDTIAALKRQHPQQVQEFYERLAEEKYGT